MPNEVDLKVAIFDVLEKQDYLNQQIQALEAEKRKLVEQLVEVRRITPQGGRQDVQTGQGEEGV